MSTKTPSYLNGLLERDDLSWAHIGDLELTTGELVIHDALTGLERAQALEMDLEPGIYPVLLGLRNEEEVAFVMVDFSGAEIVDWTPTALDSSGKPVGFTVASGIVGLTDEQGRAIFAQRQDALRTLCARKVEERGVEPTETERWQQLYREQLRELIADQPMLMSTAQIAEAISELLFVELPIDEETGENLLVFRPGQPEGTFVTYWGLDDEDDPALMLADFGLIQDEDGAAIEVSAPKAQALMPGQELVKFLVEHEQLELIDESTELALSLGRDLESIMRLPLDDEHRAIQLMEVLLEHESVEEVYLEEEELAKLLERYF